MILYSQDFSLQQPTQCIQPCVYRVLFQTLAKIAKIPRRSTLRASSCGNLVVPRTRRRIGDRIFSVAAQRAWNRLLTELKPLRSKALFHRDLKTFLFDSTGTKILIDSVMRPRSSSRGGEVQYKCLS